MVFFKLRFGRKDSSKSLEDSLESLEQLKKEEQWVDLERESLQVRAAQKSEHPAIYYFVGLSLARQGKYSESEAVVQSSLTRFEEARQLRELFAEVLTALGKYSEAIKHFQFLVEKEPENALLLTNFGRCCLSAGLRDSALRVLNKALQLDSENTVAMRTLATMASSEGNFEEAFRLISKAGETKFEIATVQAMVTACIDHKKPELALSFIQQKRSKLSGDSPEEIVDLARLEGLKACVLQYGLRRQEAISSYRKSLAICDELAETWYNYGLALMETGDIEAAEAFLKALSINPSHAKAKWNLSVLTLLDGKFDEGWDDYSLRFNVVKGMERKFPVPEWQGEPVEEGQLLIAAEQGLGDEIMFGSCISDLLQTVPSPYIECHPKLGGIYMRSFPSARIVNREQVSYNDWVKTLPDVKYYVSVGELPKLFRRSVDQFPVRSGYLKPAPDRVGYWKTRLENLGPGLRVGISWRGGISNTRADLRSVPLNKWAEILKMGNVHFINLQYSDVLEELEQVQAELGVTIHTWRDALDNYDETAALVCALDHVVSVQTALVHLCGALGVNVTALISAAPEWRYQRNGSVMPWYPSVELIRQAELANWENVLEHAKVKLETMGNYAANQ